jgi:hypothetical protein
MDFLLGPAFFASQFKKPNGRHPKKRNTRAKSYARKQFGCEKVEPGEAVDLTGLVTTSDRKEAQLG